MIVLRSFLLFFFIALSLGEQNVARRSENPTFRSIENDPHDPLPPKHPGAPRASERPLQNLDDNNIRRPAPAQARKQIPEGLATSEECREDVHRICGDILALTNLEVLSCMTDRIQNDEDLTEECHLYLWHLKLNVTKNGKFVRVAKEVCKNQLVQFPDCNRFDDLSGKLIPCLLDHKNEIDYRPCYYFLVKMGSIIFSDYRLICDFFDECKDDIAKYQCGRINSKEYEKATGQSRSHSQGATIQCLEEKIVDEQPVSEQCAKKIVRLSEFSSDDFHLDRNLYFACKDDRKKLCEEVSAGEGRVYKCLFQHKFDYQLSQQCRDALTTRQRLVAHNYKASFELQKFCSADVEKLRCGLNPKYVLSGTNDHDDIIGLSGMLLCFEDAIRGETNKAYSINPKCEMQLGEFRQMLSDDYKMSQEIVHNCRIEIADSCTGLEKDGGTIHCLMGLAERNVKHLEQSQLGDSCAKALMHLLKENKATLDYRMDRALAEACNPVVQAVCSSNQPGDPLVLSCLMEHLYSTSMTDTCQKRLLELQYFISRDFFLDPNFFKKCHKDAKLLCDEDDQYEASMPFSLVISCLYRHIPNVPQSRKPKSKKGTTTPVCAEEVRKAMKTRALEFALNPDLEDACIHSLGKYCSSGEIEKGYELVCLQDHFENITADADADDEKAEDCIEKLEEITEIEEAEAGNLNNILLRACEPEVDRLCSEERDSDEEGEVMKCLIENKHNIKQECQAGVTHFQLIELKDIKFSYAFMKACRENINEACSGLIDAKRPSGKNEVIECLSDIHLRSILEKTSSPLSQVCAAQLTVENFQRHEDNMKLNPQLKKICLRDYKKFCKSGKVKGLECLRLHHGLISPQCQKKLFGMEREEAIDPKLDTNLMRTCKAAIKYFCDNSTDGESILECLIFNKGQLEEGKCLEIVREREREQYSDINLNPRLKDACSEDINAKCKEILGSILAKERNGYDVQGEVIACLRDIELDQILENQLSKSCSRHIQFIMKEQASDYKLDPMLTLHCLEPIQTICRPKVVGNVVECMKMSYFQGKLSGESNLECIVQIARLLKEGRSDMMADPVLHDACNLDIHSYCAHVPEGKGRVVTCILDVIQRGMKPITQRCLDTIMQRKQMWDFAQKRGDVKSMGELSVTALNSQHHSSYLVIIITLILVGILVFGIWSGRLTKRLSRQRKMLFTIYSPTYPFRPTFESNLGVRIPDAPLQPLTGLSILPQGELNSHPSTLLSIPASLLKADDEDDENLKSVDELLLGDDKK